MLEYLGTQTTQICFSYIKTTYGRFSEYANKKTRLFPNVIMTMKQFYSQFDSVSSEHGISIDPEELAKLCGSTDSDVQVTKEEFMSYAKHSEFFKNQLGKMFAIMYPGLYI